MSDLRLRDIPEECDHLCFSLESLIQPFKIHKSHDSVRTSVFMSRFGVFFGTAFFIIIYLGILIYCIKQMPDTHKNTSNTIEDKNTIKSRAYFHCGPQHKTSGQDKTLGSV